MRGSSIRVAGGGVLVELIAMMPVMVVITIFCVNITVLVFAARVNEMACRDAARAAAQTSNPRAAREAALSALRNYRTPSDLITNPRLVGAVRYRDQDGQPFVNNEGPYVQVITAVRATVPAPLLFFGQITGDNVTCQQSYAFPIVKLRMPDDT